MISTPVALLRAIILMIEVVNEPDQVRPPSVESCYMVSWLSKTFSWK